MHLVKHGYTCVGKDEDRDLEDIRLPTSRQIWTDYQVRLSIPAIVAITIIQLMLVVSTALYILHLKRSICIPLTSQLHDSVGNYYPAAAAIKYETRVFQYNKTFITTSGVPTERTDAAWAELQAPSDGTIQASYQDGFDISSLVETIQSKKDPTLNMYGLEVYHQLHCLDYVRRAFYPTHYFPNETERHVNYHREHCIEHLRQSIMCSGDFALDYWRYDKETDKNWLKTDVPHICRDFTAMKDWVLENRYEYSSWEGI